MATGLVDIDLSTLWDLLGQCHVANDRVRLRADLCIPENVLSPEEDLLLAGIKTKVAEADALINEASKLIKDFIEERSDGAG